MELTTKGAKLSHDVTGESGPWLTLVHGAGDNQRCWFPQLPAFSQRHRVLTWDLRGHGSTVVTDEDYSRAAQIRDAVELWEQLGVDQGALMGYSMGGGLALELAATYPARVNALILANSGLPRRRETTEEQRRQIEERRRAHRAAGEGGDGGPVAQPDHERLLSRFPGAGA